MNISEATAPTFRAFRDGYGGDICQRLGIDISGIGTWRDYTATMVHYNNQPLGRLITAAEKFAGVASSGEFAVLSAVLGAADFAAQADKMHGTSWNRIDRLGDRAREAIAAAVLRLDD